MFENAYAQNVKETDDLIIRDASIERDNLNRQQLSKLVIIEKTQFMEGYELVRFGNLKNVVRGNILLFSIEKGKPQKWNVISKRQIDEQSFFIYARLEISNSGEDGELSMYINNDEVTATIIINGIEYQVQSLSNGIHAIQKKDYTGVKVLEPEFNEKDGTDNLYKTENKAMPSITAVPCSSTPQIRVLVLYTTAAASAVSNISSTAATAVSQMNQALANSQANTTNPIQLVGVQVLPFSFTEKQFNAGTSDDGMDNDLVSLRTNSQVAVLRNSYKADIVVFLTDGNYQSGGFLFWGTVGYTDATHNTVNIPASNSLAYTLVEADQATAQFYVFSHEVGHLLGGRHENDPASGSMHGYGFQMGPFSLWRYTVMHNPVVGGTHILYYSNPNVSYGGSPTGTTAFANAATTIGNRIPTAANFQPDPLTVSIMGGNTIPINQTGTWTSNVCGGIGSYSYNWSKDGYLSSGTASSFSTSFTSTGSHSLGLTVNDGGGNSVSTSQSISVIPYRVAESMIPISLKEAYPNPFNPSTNISFSLGEATQTKITVFDVLGKQVAILQDGLLSSGDHQVQFNAGDLPSGLYFYRLETAQQQFTKSLLLVK